MNKLVPDFSVAVVGISGRFPGSDSIEEFWSSLAQGKESISFFSDEELIESRVDPKLISNPSYVRARGVIGNSEYFDASFFGYSPREAEILDPQHRVFLETAWHAMEDAGYNPFDARMKIGVFGGTGAPLYHLEISKNPQLEDVASGMAMIIANEKDYLSTRVSYKLNLTGSSLSLQCACSTSLTAIILGMQSLLTHQNDMVLAGGVSVHFPEKQGYLYEKGGLDSPDGHCRTFDQAAQGTVFSSGAGVVVLKRLSDALRDGDQIYCVLLGGSTNNDGLSKISYTAPSVSGQVAVELAALDMAGVHPETISYVEAHGTATQIGDPIEIAALTQAFQKYTSKTNFCAIGSVKTNIGHTDVASGVIGLIKVALSMKQRTIPATLHFNDPNPLIDFEKSPFYVNVKTKYWNTPDQMPRRAIINSFGVGGSNACLVVEESPLVVSDKTERDLHLCTLSAKTSTALDQMTSSLSRYLENHEGVSPADVSFTLQVGRALFEHRRFFTFSNREEFIGRLGKSVEPSVHSIVCSDKNQHPVFMFPGQGNQYKGMGSNLYAKEPFFRRQVDKCCTVLNKIGYKYDLVELFFQSHQNTQNEEMIHQADIAQPALFIVEYALAQFLLSLGVSPKALVGHSIGEFVAACIASVMSLEDVLAVIVARGRITEQLPKGAMLAVFANVDFFSQWVKYPNEIAVINSPQLAVAAGPAHTISILEKELLSRGISCKRLGTSHAFHSHMMDDLIDPLRQRISQVGLFPPKIPILSTVTGQWLTDREAQDPDYWASHARRPVDFCSAIQKLLTQRYALYVEVGPGHSLESSLKASNSPAQSRTVGLMKSSSDLTSEHYHWLVALGKLWAYGGGISLENLYSEESRKRVSLPGYPFERRKYLLDFKAVPPKNPTGKTEKKNDISDWFYFPSWKKSWSLPNPGMQDRDCTWVVFQNGDQIGESVVALLRNSNHKVYSVCRGGVYEENSLWDLSINPQNSEDYFKLVKNVREHTAGNCRILHLWNLNSTVSKPNSSLNVQMSLFYEMLLLDQALINSNFTDKLFITFVGNNIYNVSNDDLDIFKSLMLGPCRVLKNEYPTIQSRLVDVSIPKSEREKDGLIRALIAENEHISDEIVVSYRNLARWLPVYEPVYSPSGLVQGRFLRQKGVYLITGGMGAIGLTLAEFIAENTHAKIVLIQRSSFLDRSEWDAWLAAQGDDDDISKGIRKIRQIEALGSCIKIINADLTSSAEMERAVSLIFSEYGEIHGVIHCAGVSGGGVISLKTPAKAATVLASKVIGTLVLDQALRSQKLDFFISCSSVTAILGEKGQVDYCSANAFIDAFTNLRNKETSNIYASINWGAWDMIGMAATRGRSNPSKNSTRGKPDSLRLRLVSQSNQEELYDVYLDLEHDWFIYNHRINGVPTLVGTAFFEFLSQYIKLQDSQAGCVISNVSFISPMMFFSESDKLLKLKILKNENAQLFVFFSQGQEYLRGEISSQVVSDLTKDLSSIIRRMKEEPNLRKIHADDPDMLLWVDARWKTAKRVFMGEGEWLAQLVLPSLYQSEVKEFTVYPALMDFATSFCLAYVVDVLHLPHSYGKVTVLHPLEGEVFCHSRRKEALDGFICLDLDILDKTGRVLIRIENYLLKRISENTRSYGHKRDANEIYDNILPVEGKEAFKRFFYNHTYAPQMVICAKDFNALIKENQPSIISVKLPVEELQAQHPRPQLFTPYVAPSNEIEKAVARIWENLLGIHGLGIDDNFIELGGNSLTAIQVVGQLLSVFKVEFSVDSFLGNPTIRTTTDYIINRLMETMDERDLNEILSKTD